ncbi:hypothetical protein [Agrococcus sp. SGAir0287]|uniref:hypothetical protein n=1 Tax=Agrococcus sp. SGAir0287 TaxID=2070347 RepID=UPI0010CCD55A|nr:hypothetical protein [Agrococcus sp. SGAir0287]QCR18402.1 hypothetical protein C1N71_02160 [Agrococcus sp. SGAir0287]
MLQALVELVGAILHGVGSTPRRRGDGDRPATSGRRRADAALGIGMLVVLAVCVAGVVVGVLLAVANA